MNTVASVHPVAQVSQDQVAHAGKKVPRLKGYAQFVRKICADRKKLYPHCEKHDLVIKARMIRPSEFIEKNPTSMSAKLVAHIEKEYFPLQLSTKGTCFGSSIMYLLSLSRQNAWSEQQKKDAIDLSILQNIRYQYDQNVVKICEKIPELEQRIEQCKSEEQEQIRDHLKKIARDFVHKRFPKGREFDYLKKQNIDSCEFLHQGYTLVEDGEGEKGNQDFDAFYSEFELCMQHVFKSDCSDLFIQWSFLKEGGHAIGVRPKELKLYDALVGEVQFASKEAMIADLKNYLIRNRCTKVSWRAWKAPTVKQDS
jgi:hypothetical protein